MNRNVFLAEMGKRIADRRREIAKTQEQLANEINLSLQSISCIELGKKGIRPENLSNLCRALEVSCDYILTGKKTAKEMAGILKKLAELSEKDYKMVEMLIDHLSPEKP